MIIQIDLTEICNHRCTFCHNQSERKKYLKNYDFTGKRIFPYNRLKTLLEECKDMNINIIDFTGSGEPLLHPNIKDILKLLRDLSLTYGITSNLSLDMDREVIELLNHSKYIRCSINGGTPDMYKQIHRPKDNSNLSQTLFNISRLKNVNVSYVINEKNINTIRSITTLVKKNNASSITFRDDENSLDRNKLNCKDAKSEINKIIDLEDKSFSIYYRHKEKLKIPNNLLCYYSRNQIFISPNGDIYPCCNSRCYYKYKYGNIMEIELKDFLDSNIHKNNYKNLLVKHCPVCSHDKDNLLLSK